MTEADLVAAVLESRKYRSLSPALVLRVCREIGQRYPKDKERIKAAKNELHRIYGAFLSEQGYAGAEKTMERMETPGADLPGLAREMLSLHASTGERLPIGEALYAFLRERLGQIASVMDLGCGLHPFALPMMGMPIQQYFAYDIDSRQVCLINRFFRLWGLPQEAALLDCVTGAPEQEADLAFVLKLIPVIESQRKGGGLSLLRSLKARYILVSFPTKSLGGREKGMADHYALAFERETQGLFQLHEKRILGNELFYLCSPKA